MQRKTATTIAALAATFLVFIVFSVLAGPVSAAPEGSPWGPQYFPNVPLTTQDGRVVHFYDDLIKDKIVVFDFIYTHCKDMCPLETARMAQVQKMLGDRVGKDIFFYSISIDPTADTPAVLKAYSDKFHAGSGWLFLTGKKEDIDLLRVKFGMADGRDDPMNRDGHMASVMLGNDRTGQWINNSAVDNPRFLATLIENQIVGWRDRKPTTSKPVNEATVINFTHKGQYLFSTRCSACHTIGHGDLVGPDLGNVTKVRSHDWLMKFIGTPDKVLASNDPIATALFKKYNQVQMPNLRLSPEDANYLIEFLNLQAKALDGSTPKPAPPATGGN